MFFGRASNSSSIPYAPMPHDSDEESTYRQTENNSNPLPSGSQPSRSRAAALRSLISNNQTSAEDLCKAIKKGKSDKVQSILSKIATENSTLLKRPDKKGMMPLDHAVESGNLEFVKALVDHPCFSKNWMTCQDKGGNTPLSRALRGGKLEIAEYMLSQGANIKEWHATLNIYEINMPIHCAALAHQYM